MLPGRGRSTASSAARSSAAWRANRARRSSGPVTIRDRAWLMVWIRSERAVRLATMSARIASTWPSRPFRLAGRPAGLGGPGGADGIQRVGLALPAPVLPVAAVHLHDPDPRRGEVPGQARAVTAGPFDAGQAHRAEPAQPLQQPGITGRGGRELLDAEQPAEGIERGRDVRVGVRVYAAGDGACLRACLYDGHCHPFLRLRG